MRAFTPYLNFDGNTREVMTFYQQCLGDGAALEIQTFGQAKHGGPEMAERVMHAKLTSGTMSLMASDTMENHRLFVGNNVWITQECESVEEIERVFAAFSAGGKVMMPLENQFWGARFGMTVDKYGINWMFNCDLPK
ncbi:MAG: VOC family protein [Gemmatimonas sp.]